MLDVTLFRLKEERTRMVTYIGEEEEEEEVGEKEGRERGLLVIDPGSFFDGCRITNCCRTSFSNSKNRGQVAGKR